VVKSSCRVAVLSSLFVVIGAHRALAQTEPSPSPASKAEAYYQFMLGRHLEGEDELEQSIAAFQKAAELDPTAAEVPAELAALYQRQGRLKDATVSAQAALKIDPANVTAHRILGIVFATMAGSDDADPKGAANVDNAVRQAIEHLEKAHRADGTDRDAGLDLALSRLYMHAGENQKAADLLNRVLEYEPDAAEAYVLLSRAETALGHPELAIAALEEAADGNPPLLATLAELYENQRKWDEAARTYEQLSGFNPTSTDIKTKWAAALLQKNDPSSAARARDLLTEVTRVAPTDPRPLYLLSTAERQRKDYPAAEAAAKKLIALDPDGSSGPFALAQAYEDQRLYDKAADALVPAVARADAPGAQPGRDLLTLLAHLGFAQLQAGRGEAAVRTFERARAVSKGQSGFEASLIQSYLMAKQYDKAADLARAVRQRRPDDPRFAQLEARALSQAGRKDRAVVVLRDAVAAHPDDLTTQLSLVQMLEDAGRSAEADQALAKSGEQFPRDARVPFQRGALLEKRKSYREAEAAFRAALADDPDHAPTLNYLGYMLADRGERLDEAVDLVEHALKLDPDNGSYMDSLAWAYVRQKKYDIAEPLLRKAVAQLPTNSVVQDHLGDLLWATGRKQEAVTQWRRALDGDREEIDVKAIEKKIGRAK
jgi:tetratricopeptide (TPR) repeat protein